MLVFSSLLDPLNNPKDNFLGIIVTLPLYLITMLSTEILTTFFGFQPPYTGPGVISAFRA
jgi:hypothetical protein